MNLNTRWSNHVELLVRVHVRGVDGYQYHVGCSVLVRCNRTEEWRKVTVTQINAAVYADLERAVSIMDRSEADFSDEDAEMMEQELYRIQWAMESRGIREGEA